MFSFDSLYCSEDNFEPQQPNHSSSPLLDIDFYWDDDELSTLLSKQQPNQLSQTLHLNPHLGRVRREAVDWILNVNAHYSFTPLTAVLAVNYLDRFLFSFHFQRDKPWMTQLVAVACLSLAAKVEETQVPLLLDLQVEESSRYLFEAKTIQRMEILILSTLQWKMNPVTPLSFIDYIARRLGFKDHILCSQFIKRSESIILSLISDSRFIHHLPSVVATSTLLHFVKFPHPSLQLQNVNHLLTMLGIDKDKDKVEECSKLIMELEILGNYNQSNKRKLNSSTSLIVPGSPNGVIEVSFSSDSSNDSWAVASVSSSPEPLYKKCRAANHHNVLDP